MKHIRIVLISFVFSTILLLTKKNTQKEFRKAGRFLLDEQQNTKIEEICKIGSESVNNYYSKGTFPGKEYILKNSEDEDKDVQTILGIINGTAQSSDIISYAMGALVWIVFIVLAVLVIPSWFFCCLCCCCPCCCCRQSNKNEICCKFVSFIIFCTCFAVVLSVSIYGFFGLNDVLKGFNGTTCAVMKFYIELVDGQEIEQKPKWIGIQGLTSTFDQLIGAVQNISDNADEVTKDKGEVEDLLTYHSALMTSTYTEVQNKKITFNYPDFDKTNPPKTNPVEVSGKYYSEYGPYTDSKTALYLIDQEFIQTMDIGKELVDKTAESGSTIKQQSSDLLDSINEVKSTLTEFEGTFDEFSDSIIVPWLDYQDQVNNYGDLIFKVFFGVFLGIGAIIATLTLLFVFLGIKLLKLFIHLLWNILVILLIVTFILGAIVGLIGKIGGTATGVMVYIVSDENLNKGENADILPGEVSQKLKVCFSGTGDLSSEFNFGDTTSKLDELFNLTKQLDTVIETIENNKNSRIVPEVKDKITLYKTNYLTVSSDDQYDFTELLTKCNEVTNCKTENCKVKDTWVINKEYCNEQTGEYREKNDNLAFGQKNCLVYNEWTEDEVRTRYQKTDSTSDNINTEAAVQCKKAFKEIEEDNTAAIDGILSKSDDLSKNYTDSVEVLKNKVEGTKAIITPVENVFKDLLGEDGKKVFDIINCKFLGKHVKLVIKELHGALGTNFTNFGIVIELLSTASAVGIIFLIPVMNRFHKSFPDPKKKGPNQGSTESKLIKGGNEKDTIRGEVVTVHPKGRKSRILEGGKIKEVMI